MTVLAAMPSVALPTGDADLASLFLAARAVDSGGDPAFARAEAELHAANAALADVRDGVDKASRARSNRAERMAALEPAVRAAEARVTAVRDRYTELEEPYRTRKREAYARLHAALVSRIAADRDTVATFLILRPTGRTRTGTFGERPEFRIERTTALAPGDLDLICGAEFGDLRLGFAPSDRMELRVEVAPLTDKVDAESGERESSFRDRSHVAADGGWRREWEVKVSLTSYGGPPSEVGPWQDAMSVTRDLGLLIERVLLPLAV